VESHGPHLDLTADFYISTMDCRYLKQELGAKGIEALIAPPVYWGISQDLASYPGTFSIRPETMKSLLCDIFSSIKQWGFHRVFVTNAHGDHQHIDMIRSSIAESNDGDDFRVYFMWDLDIDAEPPIPFPLSRENRYQPDYHAGAIETAQMAAFFPEKVRGDIAKTLKPRDSFHPLAYVGDPANYGLERNMAEYMRADVALDVLKMERILKRDGI
jgi:creatinine amidohydrolase